MALRAGRGTEPYEVERQHVELIEIVGWSRRDVLRAFGDRSKRRDGLVDRALAKVGEREFTGGQAQERGVERLVRQLQGDQLVGQGFNVRMHGTGLAERARTTPRVV